MSASSSMLQNSTNTNDPTIATSTTTIGSKKKRKKITIRAYQTPPQVPTDFYERQSQLILSSTSSVLLLRDTAHANLQQAHARVVDLVQLKMGPRLYQDLYQSLERAAERLVPPNIITTTTTTTTSALLTYIPAQYAQFVEYLSIVRHVCLPLDRQYVYNTTTGEAVLKRTNNNNTSTSTSSTTLLSLWQVGLLVFAKRLQELHLDQVLYDEWWNELWERGWKQGSTANRKELAECMRMWQELNWKPTILKTLLQPQLIQHLTQESQEYNIGGGNSNPTSFVAYVYQKWNFVSQQWSVFVPRQWIKSLIEVYLLQPNLPDIIPKLDLNDDEHIYRLYILTSRLEQAHEQLIASLQQYSQSKGMAILEQETYSHKAIQGLLDLYSQLKHLETKLNTTLPIKSIFTVVMAEPQAAEALAKYMDVSLKSTKTTTSPLDALLQLFCHVSAKDVFEAFYKRDLAKRLVGGKVQNMDLERHFCSLLKSECGAGYTSKMEGMFQDIEWSRETMARYRGPKDTTVDISVQVLTTGYWPVYPQYSLNIPECLQVPRDHFVDFYKRTYQGRRIAWQYALGSVTVKARFAKQYELVMSLPLALVVLCFNDADKWTLPELAARVGLDDRSEMELILRTLASVRVNLLKKWEHVARPSEVIAKHCSLVNDEDWFTVNEEFSSPLRKIKISSIVRQDTGKEERVKTMEAISRDRLYLLDAVLVRIMKARKTMLHSELIPLVMEHAKVPVTLTDVKGRIESLMDREYLERDKEDRNRYNYLA